MVAARDVVFCAMIEPDTDGRGRLTGETLGGRYLMGSLLGRGGAGEVYEAVEQRLGRRVAVKVLLEGDGDHTVRLQRMELEAKAAATLGHPNIVQVTDFSRPAGREPAYLVMELLEGESLREAMLREGQLDARRVVFIARQVLDAVAATHRANIIHRDLKPQNIFLTSVAGVRDIVKLLDFGIAKRTQKEAGEVSLTADGVLVGTFHYMSPEQITEGVVDHRTDLFSLGVVMYLALAGTPPFSGPTNAAVIFAIAKRTPPPLGRHCPDLDPGLVEVVHRALAKRPEDRFEDAEAMRSALEPWAPELGL